MEQVNQVPKRKSTGARNRSAGNGFEREIVKIMREQIGFPHTTTCRNASRYRDAQGVDLMNKDESVNGPLPYNIQCKNTARGLQYADLLGGMPKETGIVNVVLHKFTEKAGINFMPRGHFAILNMRDFFAMARELNELRAFKESQQKPSPHDPSY